MVFVGFRILLDSSMINEWAQPRLASEKKDMHDLLIALAFIGMIVAPEIVAARTDISDETE